MCLRHCIESKLITASLPFRIPKALAQCRLTLATKYPDKKLISGKGNLIDQATAAKYLALKKISHTTAIIASKVCRDLYNLIILDKGLQDKIFLRVQWQSCRD